MKRVFSIGKKDNLSFFSKGKTVIGVSFNKNILKIVCLKIGANKLEIVSLFSHNIVGLKENNIAQVIREHIDSLKYKKFDIVNILPTDTVITKSIEIPSTDPQEIKEIVNLQASRHTPYSREEIIVDYLSIGDYKGNYTKILLVIIVRSYIKKQLEIFEKAKININTIVLAQEAVAKVIPKMLDLDTNNFPVCIVHIDDHSSDFIVILKRKPIYARNIPIGIQNLLKGERAEYKSKFLEEIKMSIEAYQTESIEKTPDEFILTGLVEELRNWEKSLSDILHMNVKVLPYFSKFTISKSIMETTSKSEYLAYLNVIMPLLAWKDVEIDLLPEEIKLKLSFEEKSKEMIKTGVLILGVLILGISIFVSEIVFKKIYFQELNKKYSFLDKEINEIKEKAVRINLIEENLHNSEYFLNLLADFHEIVPSFLQIIDINFNNKINFSVKGTAASMATVFTFVDSMENSKYFKKVKTRYATKRKDGLRDLTDFELSAMLNDEAME